MSDNNEGGAFAAASSGKSPEEIAFELVNKLKGQGVWGERNMTAILDMYAECLDAAKGLRTYEGQNRVDLPTKTPGRPQAAVQAPAQASVQAPAQAATPADMERQRAAEQLVAQHMNAQAAAASAPNPVQQQQQVLQQAYTNPNT